MRFATNLLPMRTKPRKFVEFVEFVARVEPRLRRAPAGSVGVHRLDELRSAGSPTQCLIVRAESTDPDRSLYPDSAE